MMKNSINMRYYLIFLFQLIALSVSSQNKENEISSLETEMISFFQETLDKNYGEKDALYLLVGGLERYHFNYLLEVDKERLKRINKKLYSGWLYSYFLNGTDLNDSCGVYVPEGVSISEYAQTDEFRETLKKMKLKNARSVSFITDSAKHVYAKAQVENVVLPFKMHIGGFTYKQRELEYASHPAMKTIRELIDITGNIPSPVLWEVIVTNRDNICSDFKTNRDVQMFLTLYFWRYLCYYANIDFYTGLDKTEEIVGDFIYDNLEVKPAFPGGEKELFTYLYKKTSKYSSHDQKSFRIRFVVEKDGSISHPCIIKDIAPLGRNPFLKKAALEILEQMPKWKPGLKDGKPVRSYYTLSIIFKLV